MARISPGTMTALIFAILVGLGGAYAVRQYLHRPPVVAQKPPAPVVLTVPVASNDLIPGRKLTINDVALLQLSPEQARKQGLDGKPYMRDPKQIAGRVLRQEIKKGVIFLTEDFYPDGMGPGIAGELPPGHRAVTVPIHNIGAVAGFAQPGSIVDVLFRARPRDSYPETTVTLIEAIEVLAVGPSTVPGLEVRDETLGRPRETGTVTVSVTASQARALKAVEGRGELTLALRNPQDFVPVVMGEMPAATSHTTLDAVLGLTPPAPPKQIEIFRGGALETVTFTPRARTSTGLIPGLTAAPAAADRTPPRGAVVALPTPTTTPGPDR